MRTHVHARAWVEPAVTCWFIHTQNVAGSNTYVFVCVCMCLSNTSQTHTNTYKHKWNQMEPNGTTFRHFRYFVLGVGSGLAHFSHSLVRCGGRPPSHFGIRDEAHRGVHVCYGPGAWSGWMSLHKHGWNGLFTLLYLQMGI